jgi:antitoxin CptB
MASEESLPDIERLQWQCRRGMLELDHLLRDFLDTGYPELDATGRRDFVRLLDFPDQILHDWLMGHAVPREPAMQRLVALMRGSR